MNERARRTKRFVSPDRLHKDLENALAAAPSIPFPHPRKSRAGRIGSRLLVLFQIIVFIGAVMIPLAAVAANSPAAPEAAAAEATVPGPHAPSRHRDPTPAPTPRAYPGSDGCPDPRAHACPDRRPDGRA